MIDQDKLQDIIERNKAIPLLSERATACLSEAILSGAIEQETKLTEDIVASLFNISRTPAREALNKAVEDGLVVSLPRIGLVVRRWTADDIMKIFSVLIVLREYTVRVIIQMRLGEVAFHGLYDILDEQTRCMENRQYEELKAATSSFNQELVRLTNNEWLIRAINPLAFKLQLYRRTLTGQELTFDELAIIAKTNEKLLDALVAGDQKAACSIINSEFSDIINQQPSRYKYLFFDLFREEPAAAPIL